MASPEQHDGSPVPDAGGDEGAVVVQAIHDALGGLDAIREQPVSEHVERFEAVHTALTDALNKAENLLSGTHGTGS